MSDGDFVLLESMDGYTFVVPRNVACASGMLKMMLDEETAFEESKSGACKIQQRGVILLKVLEYLAYKVQYADFNAADITEDFSTRIDPYIALELYVYLRGRMSVQHGMRLTQARLTAADFLDT